MNLFHFIVSYICTRARMHTQFILLLYYTILYFISLFFRSVRLIIIITRHESSLILCVFGFFTIFTDWTRCESRPFCWGDIVWMNVFIKTRTIHLDNIVAIIFLGNYQFTLSAPRQVFAIATLYITVYIYNIIYLFILLFIYI